MKIRKHPCCMCPAVQFDFQKNVCDGQGAFLNRVISLCDFVHSFKDQRGWIFFVRKGLGENNYKAFYKKPGENSDGHGYRNLPWRKSFQAAQEDLNDLALKKGWAVA